MSSVNWCTTKSFCGSFSVATSCASQADVALTSRASTCPITCPGTSPAATRHSGSSASPTSGSRSQRSSRVVSVKKSERPGWMSSTQQHVVAARGAQVAPDHGVGLAAAVHAVLSGVGVRDHRDQLERRQHRPAARAHRRAPAARGAPPHGRACRSRARRARATAARRRTRPRGCPAARAARRAAARARGCSAAPAAAPRARRARRRRRTHRSPRRCRPAARRSRRRRRAGGGDRRCAASRRLAPPRRRLYPAADRANRKPRSSRRRAWRPGSRACSSTTPSRLRPRRAVATRQRPAATV